MLPSATQLARIGSRLAQGGNLCLSPRSSVAEAEQPLDVLSRGDEQSFGVHLLQCPRSESSRPMPVLGLPEERLDPYRTFPYGLAVGFRFAVASHPFEILLIETAPYPAPLCALGASGFEGTRVAGGGPRSVPYGPLPMIVALTAQDLALGAGVEVFFGVVSKGVLAEQGSAFFVVGQRGVGADARLLYGCYVLFRAVGAASPVTGRGLRRQRKRFLKSNSSIGRFSVTSAGVTSTSRITRALPPSTT